MLKLLFRDVMNTAGGGGAGGGGAGGGEMGGMGGGGGQEIGGVDVSDVLANNVDGQEFWVSAFGRSTHMVPWKRFIEAIEDHTKRDILKDQREHLQSSLDHAMSGYCTVHSFASFLEGNGQTVLCVCVYCVLCAVCCVQCLSVRVSVLCTNVLM